MPACSLRIPADTAAVRVARLVATAAARRCGLDEDDVDDVRLAVGEAVGRAVLREQRGHGSQAVDIRIEEDEAVFVVEVHDHGGPQTEDEAGLSMAIISGLVPSAAFADDTGGGRSLRLTWAR